MNNISRIKATLITVLAGGLFTPAVGTAQSITNVISFTATALVQNSAADNGAITTTPAPKKYSLTTKLILKQLAADEFAAGNYFNTNFPSGAKLVVVDGAFQVLDKNNNLLVGVSNIISSTDGNNDIFSGKEDDNTGLAKPTTTDLHILSVSYDDTAIVGGGNLSFYLQGLASSTTTDTTPNKTTSVYIETHKATINNAAGEGTYQGTPLVITGSLGASGSAKLISPP